MYPMTQRMMILPKPRWKHSTPSLPEKNTFETGGPVHVPLPEIDKLADERREIRQTR